MIKIMNFSNIYKNSQYKFPLDSEWIDCSDIEGTKGYCSEEASEQIRKRLKKYSISGIHFIDSGNYHYLSHFWLEKLQESADLIVFDHHTDLQRSAFGTILSCGSWILEQLIHPCIHKIYMIGVSEELIKELPLEVKSRVGFWSAEESAGQIEKTKFIERFYLSVDKDVFQTEVVETDWDQGSMTEKQFYRSLELLQRKSDLIGVDICGEPSDGDEVCLKSNRWNHRFIEFLKKTVRI